jgi:hypothetical protein
LLQIEDDDEAPPSPSPANVKPLNLEAPLADLTIGDQAEEADGDITEREEDGALVSYEEDEAEEGESEEEGSDEEDEDEDNEENLVRVDFPASGRYNSG